MRSAHVGQVKFDIGPDERMKLRDSLAMGLQNVFVMTGIFVFPGILGRSFNLPPTDVAYVYGMTFIGCGVTTLLMAAVFGRMPIVAGPYAGIFTALLTFGHLPGGNLGVGFGSLCVASLAWSVLCIPINGVSAVSVLARLVRDPAIAGIIVMLVMMQIADLAFPHWLGLPGDAAFGLVNFGSGLVTALVLMVLSNSRARMVRRLALLVALAAGAVVYEAFHPIDFSLVRHSPWIVMPRLFPFGVSVDLRFCIVYFLILVAINIQTITLMDLVGTWTGQRMTDTRLSGGVLAMMVGSAIGSCLGSFSNLPYPANLAMLRSTRVASRQVTIATAGILIAMGFCTKIDYIFVLLPVPVLSAAASVLFGIVFVHGIEFLGAVEWTERRLTIAGFSLMVGFGSLFIEPRVFAHMPFFISLLLRQPIIVGVVSLVTLDALLPGRSRTPQPTAPTPIPVPVGAGASPSSKG